MAKSDERLEKIESAIHTQVEAQSKELIRKADAFRAEQIRQHTDELVEKMYTIVQNRVGSLRQEMRSEIAKVEEEGHHRLLRRRGALLEQAFAMAKEHMQAFAASPDYESWVLELLAPWQGKCAGGTLRIRTEDKRLAPKFEELLPGCAVEESLPKSMGGFILDLPGLGIRVDETLETRLEQQRPWFLEHCGLKVEQRGDSLAG